MMPIAETAFVNIRGKQCYSNICLTPRGTRVVRTALGYCAVGRNGDVSSKRWYVGSEGGYELWQHQGRDGLVTKRIEIDRKRA